MNTQRTRANGSARPALHLPGVPRPIPYWARLIPPGELPPRAVLVRLVLALALAIVLWVRVSAEEDPAIPRQYDQIPITVNSPPGYYPVQLPASVTVLVVGLTSNLKDAATPSAFVYITSPTAQGPFPVHVVGLPPGVELRGVAPATVSLRLEKQASVTLPVKAQPFNAPPGYQVSAPSVTPRTVTITGPSHAVNAIAEVRVDLNEAGLHGVSVQHAYPVAYDHNGQPVSRRIILIQPAYVTVRVSVHLPPYLLSLPIMPNIRGTIAAGYRISRVTTVPPLVPVLSSAQIPTTTVLQTAPITVTGLTTRAVVQVPLVVPPNLTLRQPAQESVIIEVAPMPGSAVTTAQILVVGKRAGTTVTLGTSTVTVVYQGPIPLLASAAAPRAVLDLRNRQPGVYHLTPAIALAEGLTLASIVPEGLRVMITAPPKQQPHAITLPSATPSATFAPTVTATPRPTRTPLPRPTPTVALHAR